MSAEIERLADCLRDGTLVAFVGAGASRSYRNAMSGETSPGLPSARDIVNQLSTGRTNINPDMTFPEACFMLKEHEGRITLERVLQEAIDRPAIRPLPAHVILANMPCAAYVTTNFDRLMEEALLNAKKQPSLIVEDYDVSRLRPSFVPVVKLHGCVTRPHTIVAAEDEYVPFSDKLPLIEALLKTLLANKSVLFLGYGLEDVDLTLLYEQMKRLLGDRMPRSYAVVADTSSYRRELWRKRGVTVIEEDLTEFLRSLLRASIERAAPAVYNSRDDWVNNSFFASLHRIRTLPSETQAIDAFLAHLMSELQSPGLLLEDILDQAARAVSIVLDQKPNFEAFRTASEQTVSTLQTQSRSKEEGEEIIREIIEKRSFLSAKIKGLWKIAVERGDNILTYSQSVRVIELLQGVPRGIQDTCHVYIAECRPKSPVAFQDALAICDGLKETGYQLTLLPDACMGNLIARRQVNKVLIGTHAVYFADDEPRCFVNTSGTSLLVDTTFRYEVPLYVIAESSKFMKLPEGVLAPNISYEQEEQVFDDVMPRISDLKATGQNVAGINIGYDLCEIRENLRLVTERN